MALELVVGNRNASSWSMRAWLALREKSVPFTERRLDLFDPAQQREFEALPTAMVPVLIHDGLVLAETTAIFEYLEEAFPHPRLWPAPPAARARARMLVAWMATGFLAVRTHMSFEHTFHQDLSGPPDEALREANRLLDAWDTALRESGGPFLFGMLSYADLTFVPVLRRFEAFGVDANAGAAVRRWAGRLMDRPAVREWMDEALALPPVG